MVSDEAAAVDVASAAADTAAVAEATAAVDAVEIVAVAVAAVAVDAAVVVVAEVATSTKHIFVSKKIQAPFLKSSACEGGGFLFLRACCHGESGSRHLLLNPSLRLEGCAPAQPRQLRSSKTFRDCDTVAQERNPPKSPGRKSSHPQRISDLRIWRVALPRNRVSCVRRKLSVIATRLPRRATLQSRRSGSHHIPDASSTRESGGLRSRATAV